MGDVLEGGPGRSGPPRRVWLVAGLAALVAAGAYAAVRANHPGGVEAGRSPGAVQPPTESPSPSPSPWPSGAGACGSTAYRPLWTPRPLTERTGVRLLVGGYGVRLVDADTGTARPVRGIPADARQANSDLVTAGGATYVLSSPCNSNASRVYRLVNGTARPVAGGSVNGVLAGETRVWAVNYPDSAAPTSRVLLRPLGGGRSLALPPDSYPVADTSAGLVVAGTQGDPEGRPPDVTVLDPATGRPVRSLGAGRPLAADRTQVLLMHGPCDEGEAIPSCTLASIDVRTGQVQGRYPLPNGRVPASAGYLSRDGRLVAFQLARVHPDPRIDPGHPVPPSDVVLLNLDTGRLDVVPGLELAPKSAAGLVFAADRRWLFATVSDGDHAHVLAWRPGLGAPRSVARLPGPVVWAPPLLVA